ncbi:MAG: hypothetical protein LH679_06070 [Cyanobacteria bacterium CAN_BIN43]|nr:hypothetical protein [Cyanobacteria bacterium CAN_BIN43]
MLTYTSTALVSLILSFSSVPVANNVDYNAELQPANASQTLEISLTRPPHPPSYRGSGRIRDGAPNYFR